MEKKYTKIKERVLYIADYKGVRKEKFLESLGMTYGSFKGKAKEGTLNSAAIEKIYTNHSDINIGWLLTGRGSMLLKEGEAAEPVGTVYKEGEAIKDRLISQLEGENRRLIASEARLVAENTELKKENTSLRQENKELIEKKQSYKVEVKQKNTQGITT